MRNRTKILLLALVTLLLTAVAVSTAGYWYAKPATVTMAVGPDSSPSYKFAAKLAEVLVQNHASIRLSLVEGEHGGHSLSRFSRNEVDLAVLRTDERKIFPTARAIAILEHEALLLITPKQGKLRSLADLERKKVVVVGREGRNEAFVRRLLEQYKHDPKLIDIRTVPPGTPLEKLLAPGGGADVAVVLEPLSRLSGANDFEELSRTLKGFAVHPVADAQALERKLPGVFAETIEAGLLSGSPRIPAEDMDTVALQRILVARAGLPDQQVVELMRALFENRRQLTVEGGFASQIEPPSTEKGALIPIHDGADQYVASEVKTFFDRYSDLIYIGMSVASVLGSSALALYSTIFRHPPVQASALAAQLMALRDRARNAGPDQLDAIAAELEAVLDEVLTGLGDGSISPRGLEAFRLAYDTARDAISQSRDRCA